MAGRDGSTRFEGSHRGRTVSGFAPRGAHGDSPGFRVESSGFVFDASALPLVITTVRGLDTIDDVLELEQAFLRVYERREPRIFITEIEAVERIDRRVRHAAAEMARRLAPHDIALSLGAAVVVGSPLLRATIVALKWIAKPTTPESYVATREEAARITRERMRAAGIGVDGEVEAQLRRFVHAPRGERESTAPARDEIRFPNRLA